MPRPLCWFTLLLLATMSVSHLAAQTPDAERSAMATLQSDRPPAEKAAACRTLRTIGTAESVPALAALLADKDLAYWARHALQSMPCPEAGAALRTALGATSGLTQAGVVNSLGERHDGDAVPRLAELLRDSDLQLVSCAATALGKIGGQTALAALRSAKAKAPASVQPAFAEGLLLAADHLLAAHQRQEAAALYGELYEIPGPEHVRVAAFRGTVLAAGDQGAALVVRGLTSEDRAARRAALQLVREIPGEAATKGIAAVVSKVVPAVKVALLEALEQRRDPAALPAVVVATGDAVTDVRLAAIRCLGTLGDASTALRLAERAAQATGVEQEAAREALGLLKDPQISQTLLAALPQAAPEVQREIVQTLGQRLEQQAVPALLNMARTAEEATRLLALRSLATLADGEAAAALIQLLRQAKTDPEREAAEHALVAACGRSSEPIAYVAKILAARQDTAIATRAALLRAAGRLGGNEALVALRAGVRDEEAALRDAAVRTLAESAGLEAAADLLALAGQAPSLAHRVLALRGYLRLAALTEGRSAEARAQMCRAALPAAQRPEEQKLLLTAVAQVPHLEALQVAEELGAQEAVRAEAQAACVQIAASIVDRHPAEAKTVLRQLATAAQDPNLRSQATKVLEAMDQYVGYLATWQVAGPYRQAGKQCAELFDTVFPPEQPGASEVKWQPAPAPTNPALYWQVDLDRVVNGDQCVVYLKTRVYVPREQKVRLEVGSDDGIKLWINGQLVHAKNTMRPLQPGQDTAEAVLKAGGNDFFAKVTQNNMGCGLCVRVRNADGSILDGLRCE